MAFIAQSITVFYDMQQDRLNLLFIENGEQEIMGAMTRQLLKGLLAMLPEWLAKQPEDLQPAQQQREINQFHHQAAQQNIIASYNSVLINKALTPFLLETINLAKEQRIDDGKVHELIRLTFMDKSKGHQIILTLTPVQLHKLMGEILVKVEEWSLPNPWHHSDYETGVAVSLSGVMH